MTLWILAALIAALAAAGLVWPLLRRQASPEAAKAAGNVEDLAVYRDQLAEIEGEVERGLLEGDQAAAARLEIQRRLLAAAGRPNPRSAASRRAPLAAGAVAVFLLVGSLGLYGLTGAPGLPSQPLTERLAQQQRERSRSGDIASRAALLRQQLEAQPEDIDGWTLLARTYFHLQRYRDAAETYRRALELDSARPGLLSAYAEALTQAQGNRVTRAARLAFEQAAAAQPEDPRARYYLALFEAQAQNYHVALARWQDLLADTPANAPWRSVVLKAIRDMAELLELDPATVLREADLAASANGGPVAALRDSLKQNPKDWQGWLSVARAESRRGDREAARRALDEVAGLYATAPFVQQQIRQTAAELGLREAGETSGGRGPSRNDVAAAAQMTTAERGQMIEGMVARLAERLDGEPDDLEGWQMLIRSYAVLGKKEQARSALRKALARFESRAAAQRAIRRTATQLGLDF